MIKKCYLSVGNFNFLMKSNPEKLYQSLSDCEKRRFIERKNPAKVCKDFRSLFQQSAKFLRSLKSGRHPNNNVVSTEQNKSNFSNQSFAIFVLFYLNHKDLGRLLSIPLPPLFKNSRSPKCLDFS